MSERGEAILEVSFTKYENGCSWEIGFQSPKTEIGFNHLLHILTYLKGDDVCPSPKSPSDTDRAVHPSL